MSFPIPHLLIARSVASLIRQESALLPDWASRDHDQAVGGILVGKRLVGNRIAIVGASAPGPSPQNRQLGFALDSAHADAMREHWSGQDPEIDVVGLWHTHPPDLVQPTTDDVRVAHMLVANPAFDAVELVAAIVLADPHAPSIRWFFLSQDVATSRAAFITVTPEELDDTDPVFREPGVAGSETSRVDSDSPPVSTLHGEHDASLQATAPPRRSRWVVPAVLSLLIVLLAGIALARVSNGPDERVTHDDRGSNVVASHVTAAGDLPRATALPGGTRSTGWESTTTPSILPITTTTVIVTPGFVPVTPSPVITQQPGPSDAVTAAPDWSVAAMPEPQPSTRLMPYELRVVAMDTGYQQDFQARMRQVGCAGCYNVEIVGPTPFVEVLIRVAGSGLPPLRNYRTPSPVAFVPRAEPYMLQVFGLDDQPLSEPVAVTVSEGEYYVLEIRVVGPT